MTAIGIILLDNYDDIIDQMDDKYISTINTLVTTLISDWANDYQIFYKRINAEKYFFVAKDEDIERMKEDQFSLLKRVKETDINSDFVLSLSMGISYGNEDSEKIGEVAQNNLDLAQARGGDQVVVKSTLDDAKPQFYGGNSDGIIRRTRTRSRAMSLALRKIFSENQRVFVMGHRYPDMDAIGASFGVASLAKLVNKEAYVVLDKEHINEDTHRFIKELNNYPELDLMIVKEEQALAKINEESVLVMVDYHKPSMSISQKVYESFDKIIIIDHHRRSDEFPVKPLLSYIETSASSASELVAEFIQFQVNRQRRLSKFIATMLLSGIYVDTKNFTVSTSNKTFDMASFLKSQGADIHTVQELLSSDLETFIKITRLVTESGYYSDDVVIAAADDQTIYDSVIVAKTADTLLSLYGIHASFVITKQADEVIGISARSSGAINVQKIMESLGGGGHFTNAATQIKERTIAEVKQALEEQLDKLKSIEE